MDDQPTDPTVQIIRLKQNANVYHCWIIVVLFGEKQHKGVCSMFHSLTVQKWCWLKHLESKVYSQFPVNSPTRPTIPTIALKQLKYDICEFKRLTNRCTTFQLSIWICYIHRQQFWKCNWTMNIKKQPTRNIGHLSDLTIEPCLRRGYKYEIFIASCTDGKRKYKVKYLNHIPIKGQ